jgi:pyruvate/2-oxoglutarate dehydrogenase complex dihydrolipoamide acyltransferase (E2) component
VHVGSTVEVGAVLAVLGGDCSPAQQGEAGT